MYYRCQDRFDLDLIFDMYDDNNVNTKKYGVCLISGKELLIYSIEVSSAHSYNVNLLTTDKIRLVNKHKKGGQSSARFGRIADSIRDNEAEETAHTIVSTLMYDNHTKCHITKLIIGGFGPMKDDVVQTQHFQQHLSSYLHKIITIPSSSMNGEGAKSILLPLLEEINYSSIKHIDNIIDDTIRINPDLLVFSREECMPLLMDNILKHVYISNDFSSDLPPLTTKQKECVTITKSNKVKSMGGWVGVRLYAIENEIEIEI